MERNLFCLGEWCVFHEGEGPRVGRIILFSSSGLQKCKEIRSIRRSKNLKYKNVTLPEQIGGLEGYHMTCYRRFTALSKEYTKEIQPRLLQIIPQDLNLTSYQRHQRKQSLVNVETPDFENKIKE